MERGCRKEECTVQQTGKCALSRDPNECSERLDESEGPAIEPSSVLETESTLAPPPEKPKLPNSLTLDLDQIRSLGASRQTTLVGVLGCPDSGKTAALVSLYLLLAHNRLEGFRFANSLTVMALDEISRGARRWSEGARPDQMTVHTEISTERGAGFMHLRVLDQRDRLCDLLVPDLPGEWSNSLVDENRVEQWYFLKSADVLCFFVDGRQLASKRQSTVHRTKLLIQKAAALVAPRTPPAILVVSHRDAFEPNAAALQQIIEEAARYDLQLQVVPIASFTKSDSGVQPGFGIATLVATWVNPSPPPPLEFWPDTDNSWCNRAMLRFRGPK